MHPQDRLQVILSLEFFWDSEMQKLLGLFGDGNFWASSLSEWTVLGPCANRYVLSFSLSTWPIAGPQEICVNKDCVNGGLSNSLRAQNSRYWQQWWWVFSGRWTQTTQQVISMVCVTSFERCPPVLRESRNCDFTCTYSPWFSKLPSDSAHLLSGSVLTTEYRA